MIIKENIAIQLKEVSKTFHKSPNNRTIKSLLFPKRRNNSDKYVVALDKINMHVSKGECIGIIGHNGSGKSTLLNIIMGTIRASSYSQIFTQGKIMRLTLGMGVDKNLSARDNIYVNGSILGLSFKKIGDLFDEIISFSELEEFVDIPVKFYSRGMLQRLLFAIAMYAEADIFLLDEFFGGVGDENYKKKSDQAFEEKILREKTIIIVSHNMNIIKKFAQRCIWLDHGKIILNGDTNEVLNHYIKHYNNKIQNDS